MYSKNIIIIIIIMSYHWLESGNIKGETESTIVAAQDQAFSTNYFKNKILKQEVESKCRLCKQHEETIDHLTSGCPILAKNGYLMRHDKVCTHFNYSICKALGTETTDKWYTHTCPSQCVKKELSQFCGIKQYTQRKKLASRPDIKKKKKKEKTCTLIDVAIPAHRNVMQKEAEKKLKYKSLCIEIQ
jgi:hypothetical protein